MSKSKQKYNLGLEQLRSAIEFLTQSKESFAASSNSMDDFPTARHEIMDISKRVKKMKEDLAELESFADIN